MDMLIFTIMIGFWLSLALFFMYKGYVYAVEEVQDLQKIIEDLKDERDELLQTIELLKQNKGRMPNPDEC